MVSLRISKPLNLSSFLLLPLLLLLRTVISTDPLYHFCSDLGNYTSDGPFDQNYNQLITSLTSKVPPTGFGLDTVGLGQDVIYGLALCRGDVAGEDCKACVVEASGEIRKRCGYNNGAIIWYDNCMLRYSRLNFLGIIDYQYRVYLYNVESVSNPAPFNEKVKELLSRLSVNASGSPVLFATEEEEIGDSKKLYGLVQCSRDISSKGCKKCLDHAISELPSCCDGKVGGRVIGGSCNFRYEIYPFFKS